MNPKIIQFLNQQFSNTAIETLQLLSGGGSARKYYRFWSANQSYILAESDNLEENRVFIDFTERLNTVGSNYPKVLICNEDQSLYVQTDLGDTSLMDVLSRDSNQAKTYYFEIVSRLAEAQLKGRTAIDFHQTFSYPKLDKTLILRDLFQFKFYFLNFLEINYNQGKLIADFDSFAVQFDQLSPSGFVFRDFQSRNIMIKDQKPYFIDYQGGLFGPIFYDLVSLIWQAKANLDQNFKEELYHYYLDQVMKCDTTVKAEDAERSYQYCVVARLLQVLGAYGLRGLIERKPHFVESIAYGLENLNSITSYSILDDYNELKHIINLLIAPRTLEHINHKING